MPRERLQLEAYATGGNESENNGASKYRSRLTTMYTFIDIGDRS